MNKPQIVSIKFSYVLLPFTLKRNTEKRTKLTKINTKTKTKTQRYKIKTQGSIGRKHRAQAEVGS